MVLALCALLKWNLDLWTFTDRIAVGMLKIIPLQLFFKYDSRVYCHLNLPKS